MKDYLSSAEREKFLLTAKLMDSLDQMLEWDTLSKDERKALKTASTMIYKGLNLIIDRLGQQPKKTLAKALDGSGVYLTNKYGLELYLKKKEADEKASYEASKAYYDLVEEVCHQCCNGCLKKHSDCNLHTLFEENYISDFGDTKFGNCRFAYNLKK